MDPFRDDAVWREQRGAELEDERAELEAALAQHTEAVRVARRERISPVFENSRSVLGVAFLVIALAGGYVVGRWVVPSHAHECR